MVGRSVPGHQKGSANTGECAQSSTSLKPVLKLTSSEEQISSVQKLGSFGGNDDGVSLAQVAHNPIIKLTALGLVHNLVVWNPALCGSIWWLTATKIRHLRN